VLDGLPFPRGTLGEVLPWIRQGSRPSIFARRPDLPAPLSALVGRMIAPQPDVRPQTATQAISELTATLPVTPSDDRGSTDGQPSIGPWILGERVYSSGNWDGWLAMHQRTGAAARLMQMRPDAPLSGAKDVVLQAAER